MLFLDLTNSESDDYHKFANESDSAYKRRILEKNGEEVKENCSEDVLFVNLLVKNKEIFNKVLPELSTLDLKLEKYSLFSKVNDSRHLLQLVELVERMFKLRELDCSKGGHALKTLKEANLARYSLEQRERIQQVEKWLQNEVKNLPAPPPISFFQITEKDLVPDEFGIYKALVEVIELDNTLLEKLHKDGISIETELMLRILIYGDEKEFLKKVNTISSNEFAVMITLGKIKAVDRPLTFIQPEITLVIESEAFYKKIEHTINPGENALDIALRNQNYELLSRMIYEIKKSGNPELEEILNTWKTTNTTYQELGEFQAIYEDPFYYAASFGKQESLQGLCKEVIASGDQSAIEKLKIWDPYLKWMNASEQLTSARNAIMSKRKKEVLYNYNPKKKHSKQFVARHPSEGKTERARLKTTIKNLLDSEITLANLKNPRFADPNVMAHIESDLHTERFICYFKNAEGNKDKYLLISPVTGAKYPHMMVIKNDKERAILRGFNDSSSLSIFQMLKEINDFSSLSTSKFLSEVLKGDNLEIVHTYLVQDSHHIPDDFWDDWTKTQGDLEWPLYRQAIHPILASSVCTLLESLSLDNTPSILDICGGTGALADKILTQYAKPLHYTLLENNKKSLEVAQATLGERASIVQTDVVKDPVYYEDSLKQQPIPSESIDLVVGSGALTVMVMKDKPAALTVLSKIHQAIKPGGYLVLAGYAASILEAADFQNSGFMVINTHMPGHGRELYILQKPTRV